MLRAMPTTPGSARVGSRVRGCVLAANGGTDVGQGAGAGQSPASARCVVCGVCIGKLGPTGSVSSRGVGPAGVGVSASLSSSLVTAA